MPLQEHSIAAVSMVKKIEELRTETGNLFIAYVPEDVPAEQYKLIKQQLIDAVDTAGINFIIVPDTVRIEALPAEGELDIRYNV